MANSKYLTTFLLETPGEREAFNKEHETTKKSNFIVDSGNDSDGGDGNDDGDDYEDELFDYVCALCDNGGDLLACEGRCIRSFHATVDAGAESLCDSLGYTDAQVDAIQTFLCKNCRHQQHQCFVCGMLGSSNKSSAAEVFPCVSATCGHFYHPKCVAEQLYPGDGTQAKELQEKIAAGESFICPAHKCAVCKHGEDKKVNDLQFALCRRCPKAFHRRCLPRRIAFSNDENIQQRAWDGLLPNRILIYCLDHKILPELGTPARNHILFPDGDGRRKEKVVGGKRSNPFGNLRENVRGNVQKPVERMRVSVQCGDSINEKGVATKSFKDNSTSVSEKVYRSFTVDKSKSSLRNDQSNTVASIKSCLHKSTQQSIPSEKTKNMLAAKSTMIKASTTQPSVDAEMEKRILTLMKTSTSSFNMEEFVKDQKKLCTYSYSSKTVVDKTITKGKVEGSVKAARAALKKLEEDSSVEDAKAVCEPEILRQIMSWKRKLGIYLSPFLNGMRYTSFGRHFTKLDKLKEIVDRLQWYVQDGDMIVDFCCGSNDFSCLMKEKLEKMRKNCFFKNFDLFTPKNDFNFEKRDWMTVHLEELPAGSTLSFYLPGSVDVHNQQMDQWNLNAPPLYLWSHPDWTIHHKEIARKHGHLHNEHGEEMHTQRKKDEKRAGSNYLMEESHDCYGDFSNVINGCDDISKILDDVPEDPYDTQIENTGPIFPTDCRNIPFGQDRISQLGKSVIEEKLDDMDMDMEMSPVNSPVRVANATECGYVQSSMGALPYGTDQWPAGTGYLGPPPL
ncbi:hypothetical protein LguiA_035309 [Lonicera macranthoides]